MNGLIVIGGLQTAKNGNKFATTLTGEAYYFANKGLAESAKVGAYAWAIEQKSDKTYQRKEDGTPVLDNDGNRVLIERKEAITLNRITQVFASAKEAFTAKNQALLMKVQEKAVLREAFNELGEEFGESVDVDAILAQA